ncbi:MAG: alpha/beta hydrolase [Schleiferiaceae bacterium]|nr:alpha/beta hydrolase [Schleiferiaceae bacterium]
MDSTRFTRSFLSLVALLCWPIIIPAQQLKVHEVDVQNSNSTGTLSGTLTTVQNARKRRDQGILAILLPGSGPTDRHGSQATYPMRTLDLVAAECHSQGISTLQFDKRGIGASTFEGTEAEITYSDLVQDVLQWTRWTQSFSNLVLIGHSEGGQMALTLTAKYPEFGVKGLILLAAPAERASDILWRQLQRQMDASSEYGLRSKSALDSLKAGFLLKGAMPVALQSLFRPSVQPYLMDWFKDDPIRNLNLCSDSIPVFFFYGGKDIQVELTDGARQNIQANALNHSVRIEVIPSMTHPLKADVPGQRLSSYTNGELPLDPEFVEKLSAALQALKDSVRGAH